MGNERDSHRGLDALIGPSGAPARLWLVVLGAVALVAGHALVLYRAWSATTVSTAVAFVVVGLVAVKHLGWLGPLYTFARRRFRSDRRR